MPYDLSSLFSSLGGGNFGGLLQGLASGFGSGLGSGGGFGSAGMPAPGSQNAVSSALFQPYPGAPIGPYAIPQGMPAPDVNQLTAAPTNLPQAGAIQPPLQEGATPSLNQGGYARAGGTGRVKLAMPLSSAQQLLAWVLGQSGGGMDEATQQTLQHAAMLHQLLLGGGGYGGGGGGY